MQPRAFLEKIGKEWLDDFVYISKFPLEERGYQIVPFECSNKEVELYFTKNGVRPGDVIVGSVEASSGFFKAMGVSVPSSISYHNDVFEFLFREPKVCKIGDLDGDYPYFIKPAEKIKLFTGTVIEKRSQIDLLCKFYEGITTETLVWKSQVINLVSEYRCFVNQGDLRGIQFYTGDFRIFPDVDLVKKVISSFKSAPISYTIDVGIDSTGKTILIELNDMWAIGSYGLNGTIYAKCLTDRIHQITGYGIPSR